MNNLLLARFPVDVWSELSRHAETVTLVHGDHVNEPDRPVRVAVFPLTCLLSLVTTMEDGSAVESGCIGREGMFGVPALLDAEQTPVETTAQVPGEAIRLPVSVLKEAYDQHRTVRALLNRYIHIVTVNGSQSAACNALHQIETRLCRWLLVSADGIGSG